MSSESADAPLTPDLPPPPGQEDVAVPDLAADRPDGPDGPDDRETPDGTAVSGQAGTVEAPD